MSNQSVILVYLPLAMITAILLVAILRRDKTQQHVRLGIAFYFLLFLWEICEMLFFAVSNPALTRYLFDLKLVFISFLTVIIFVMVASFYRVRNLFPRWLTPLLCAVPAITSILALTSPWHSLLRRDFQLLNASPLKTIAYSNAPWFAVHGVYSHSMVAAVAILVFFQYHKLPVAYRRGSSLMMLSVIHYGLGVALAYCGPFPLPLDFMLIGTILASIYYYLAIVVNNRANYLNIERKEIFNYLDEGVFILDEKGAIVDVNRSGQAWLETMETPLHYISFQEMLLELKHCEKISVKSYADGDSVDLYTIKTDFPLIYNMQTERVFDSAGREIGSFVTMTDVTRSRLYEERLRSIAGIDALTGLKNRYGYQEALRRIDRTDFLPISIIFGDVNGLKKVNDTLGHDKGDKMLRDIAGVIQAICGESGTVARIGGDEFAVLLPNCGKAQAVDYINGIHENLRSLSRKEYPVSIALGCATKYEDGQNINALISEADKTMYQTK